MNIYQNIKIHGKIFPIFKSILILTSCEHDLISVGFK